MRGRILFPLWLAVMVGCKDGPTSPQIQTAVGGLFREGSRLQVGEVLAVTAGEAQAIFLDGGADGSEYLLVPFNASDVSTNNLVIEVTGGNVRSPSGTLNPALVGASPPGIAPESDVPVPDWVFHQSLREQEIHELTRLIPAARELRAMQALRSVQPAQQVVPNVGDVLTINASREGCANPDVRRARVAAVTDRAIVVEDLTNPPGGFTGEEFRSVGMTFDTLIYPVDTRNFGTPTDIDNNGRVIIFYTRVVNELTEPNSDSFVGGFFFGRDLFPREAAGRLGACATSNVAEIFYLLAPDPTGAVNGNVRSKEFVLRSTLGTVAHEFQHLINAARRLYVNNAPGFEEVWLNEGLSHIAEELQFYAITPLEPRQNISVEMLRSSPQIVQAFNTYQVSNFGRYNRYLKNPDEESLLGIDNLPTRGASWAFLRYAADHEPGADENFFFRLVNSSTSGVRNLSNVLGANAIDFMQTWTVSVFTDDGVRGIGPRYQQPSWNFRSIIPVFNDGRFPLEIIPLTGTQTTLTLKGGGGAFLRFGVAPGQRAALTVLSGGAVPPERLRVSVVRLQ
ncbi:MAG: hypothetical protein M3497_00825 [Gemmatimonadota bacterium]|nr:hypothetical protein [Gemmatimonadota bacterium]